MPRPAPSNERGLVAGAGPVAMAVALELAAALIATEWRKRPARRLMEENA
jgi:hypothetical protein